MSKENQSTLPQVVLDAINKQYPFTESMPRKVEPEVAFSWDVAMEAFREAAKFGYGLSTPERVEVNAIHCTCPNCGKDYDIEPVKGTTIPATDDAFINRHLLKIQKYNRAIYADSLDNIIQNIEQKEIEIALKNLETLRDTIKNYDK